ncbi:MAG: M17 family metallopeptidase, partial [Lysobacterales bacterium]
LVIAVIEDAPLLGLAKSINQASGDLINNKIGSGDIDTSRGSLTLFHDVAGVAAKRILVVGCGTQAKLDRARFEKSCLDAGKFLRDHAVKEAHFCVWDVDVEDQDEHWRLRQAALAVDRSNYLYTATKPVREHSPKPLQSASFSGGEQMQAVLDQAQSLARGFRTARELGNLPANICTPAYLADQARAIAERYQNTKVEILQQREMSELGMHALLAVGQGSTNTPRLIILKYRGAAEEQQPVVFVGKGITFDTGGISIKPALNMDQMKFDMCGAAAVIGAFESCADLQLPINLVSVVAAAENMPGGNATRPGDIVHTHSGQTVEILNTDAAIYGGSN